MIKYIGNSPVHLLNYFYILAYSVYLINYLFSSDNKIYFTNFR